MTGRGEVVVSLAQSTHGGYSLYHVSGRHCFAAVAQNTIAWQGNPLVSGPWGNYIYVFCADDGDILTSQHIYLKCDVPGLLTIPNRNAPKVVNLVKMKQPGFAVIDALDYIIKDKAVTIMINPTQQAYWVSIEW